MLFEIFFLSVVIYLEIFLRMNTLYIIIIIIIIIFLGWARAHPGHALGPPMAPPLIICNNLRKALATSTLIPQKD